MWVYASGGIGSTSGGFSPCRWVSVNFTGAGWNLKEHEVMWGQGSADDNDVSLAVMECVEIQKKRKVKENQSCIVLWFDVRK